MAFCKDCVSNVREEYLGHIKSMRAFSEKKKAAVTMGKQQLATVAAAVTASGANDEEQRAQIIMIMAQLEEAEDNVETADNILETLRTNMEAKEAGVDDPENVDWLRNIEAKTDNDAKTVATFKREIVLKLNSIPEAEWQVYTNVSSRNGKDYTTAMIHLATYFDQKFTLATVWMLRLLGVNQVIIM